MIVMVISYFSVGIDNAIYLRFSFYHFFFHFQKVFARIRHILLLIFCYFIATRVLQGQRDEATKVDNQMAKNDAKELQEVTRKAVIEQSVYYNKVNDVIERSGEWVHPQIRLFALVLESDVEQMRN